MEKIQILLQSNIPDAKMQINDLTGTMDHLEIIIGSQIFEDKSLIEQHQILMDILKKEFDDQLHAVKLKTMNLSKYTKKYEA